MAAGRPGRVVGHVRGGCAYRRTQHWLIVSSVMPHPVSSTLNSTSIISPGSAAGPFGSAGAIVTVTVPDWVNLRALTTRLRIMRAMRALSHTTCRGKGARGGGGHQRGLLGARGGAWTRMRARVRVVAGASGVAAAGHGKDRRLTMPGTLGEMCCTSCTFVLRWVDTCGRGDGLCEQPAQAKAAESGATEPPCQSLILRIPRPRLVWAGQGSARGGPAARPADA